MRNSKRSAALLLAFAVFCLASAPLTDACPPDPIPNMPLWAAVQSAELIVVGKVVEIDANEVLEFASSAQDFVQDVLWDQGIQFRLPEIEESTMLTIDVEDVLIDTTSKKTKSTVRFEIPATHPEEINPVLATRTVFFLSRQEKTWRLKRYPVFQLTTGDVALLRQIVATGRTMDTPEEAEAWQALTQSSPRFAPIGLIEIS